MLDAGIHADVGVLTPTQGELLGIELLDDGFFREEEHEGRYTAKRFFSKRPDDYKTCITLLAANAGVLKIARLLKVHHRTVAAVRDSEGEAIDIAKQRIRTNFRLAVEVASERLADEIMRIPIAQLPVAAGILVDKLAILDGEPSARLEVTHNFKLTHDGVIAELSKFPDAEDGEFTPVAQTGFPGAERGQKAGGGEGGGEGGGDEGAGGGN